MAQEITQERLKELLHYEPETGVFTWLQSRTGIAKAGGVAGGDDGKGYRRISVDGARHLSHRLAWLYMCGEMPVGLLDHKDRDPANNRISNLRPATSVQNGLNTRQRPDNTSGHTGVSWNKRLQKWQACIRVSKKLHYLGLFTNILDAAAARKAGEVSFGVSEFCPQ